MRENFENYGGKEWCKMFFENKYFWNWKIEVHLQHMLLTKYVECWEREMTTLLGKTTYCLLTIVRLFLRLTGTTAICLCSYLYRLACCILWVGSFKFTTKLSSWALQLRCLLFSTVFSISYSLLHWRCSCCALRNFLWKWEVNSRIWHFDNKSADLLWSRSIHVCLIIVPEEMLFSANQISKLFEGWSWRARNLAIL